MADYLVVQGMPFRQAHECVGKTVGYALEKGKQLHELGLHRRIGEPAGQRSCCRLSHPAAVRVKPDAGAGQSVARQALGHCCCREVVLK